MKAPAREVINNGKSLMLADTIFIDHSDNFYTTDCVGKDKIKVPSPGSAEGTAIYEVSP